MRKFEQSTKKIDVGRYQKEYNDWAKRMIQENDETQTTQGEYIQDGYGDIPLLANKQAMLLDDRWSV